MMLKFWRVVYIFVHDRYRAALDKETAEVERKLRKLKECGDYE